MLDTLLHSYCYKHNLMPDSKDNGSSQDKPLTEEEIKKVKAIIFMMGNLNDNTYHKLIEAK